jgi:glycosyltransferase involved in cell wall biosynthesis
VVNSKPFKRVVLVAPEFVPRNLAGVMRTRFLAAHLAAFGWTPTVLTLREECYEGTLDDRSRALLEPEVRVERVGAWPASWCRPFGMGDVSLRAQWSLRRRLAELIHAGEVDLVFVTMLPGYSCLVGAWAKRKFGVPLVLDYQDPWVTEWGARQPLYSKAGLAHRLATWLEPAAARAADAFTAVSSETLDTLRERGLMRPHTPVEILPIGADPADHAVAARFGRSQIQRSPDELVLAYLGTLTERMLPATEAVFRAAAQLQTRQPKRRVSLHFIGTSAQAAGRDVHGLVALARACGVGANFRLEPRRVDYLDALSSMQSADVLLLLGSTDSHYTASKIFPCWLSGRPVFGLFHEASTVTSLAHELGGVGLVTYRDGEDPRERVAAVATMLEGIGERGLGGLPTRQEGALEPYSARGLARRFAGLFDRVWASSGRN